MEFRFKKKKTVTYGQLIFNISVKKIQQMVPGQLNTHKLTQNGSQAYM